LPQNPNLDPVVLPMPLRFGEEHNTTYTNNIKALKVELVDTPTRRQMWNVAWRYTKSTWADSPDATNPVRASDAELSRNLEDVLNFRALPTPMEAMGFTFQISGLSFQDVTHIIRHRAGSFAAQCTGDRDLRNDPSVIPGAVENSPEFLARWTAIVEASKQLYVDMVDDKTVSLMDARLILPKSMSTFYQMRLNFKDLLGFIKQRQDMQIQPSSDNIIAALMAKEVLRVMPEASTVVDFTKPDMHYIKTFRVQDGDKWVSRGTNLYWPEPKNDVFEYHPNDSIYQCRREELNGTNPPEGPTAFETRWDNILSDLDTLKMQYSNEKLVDVAADSSLSTTQQTLNFEGK
jgi:thymidylate synthase ThyX